MYSYESYNHYHVARKPQLAECEYCCNREITIQIPWFTTKFAIVIIICHKCETVSMHSFRIDLPQFLKDLLLS